MLQIYDNKYIKEYSDCQLLRIFFQKIALGRRMSGKNSAMNQPTQNQEALAEAQAIFEASAKEIASLLFLNGYPRRPLFIEAEKFLTLEIRIPPHLPPTYKQGDNITETLRAFPAIERIQIAEDFQGKGFFTKIVEALAHSDGVKAVVISNVANQEFANRLFQRCKNPDSCWTVYSTGHLPSFAYWSHNTKSQILRATSKFFEPNDTKSLPPLFGVMTYTTKVMHEPYQVTVTSSPEKQLAGDGGGSRSEGAQPHHIKQMRPNGRSDI